MKLTGLPELQAGQGVNMYNRKFLGALLHHYSQCGHERYFQVLFLKHEWTILLIYVIF